MADPRSSWWNPRSWPVRTRGRAALAAVVALALVVGVLAVLPGDAPGGGTPGEQRKSLLERALGGIVGGRQGGPDRAKPPAPQQLPPGAVPRADAPIAGKAWSPAKRVQELTDRRSANGKIFQLSDGRLQAEISAVPVHYRDAAGRYRPIDTAVGPVTGRAGFPIGNTSNAFTSLFGNRSDRVVRFEVGGRQVEFGLPGQPVALTPRVAGSSVTYPAAAGGADLVYEVTAAALTKKLVLPQRPQGAFRYSFTVRADGVEPVRREDGSIAFVGKDRAAPLFLIPPPFMYDDRADAASPVGKVWSDKVSQSLSQDGALTTVTLTADPGWLADAARDYPVTIDPTIKIQPVPTDAQDVAIYSGNTTANYNNTYQLKVGTDATQAWRTLVKFPLTGVPAGTQLTDAQLQLFYDQTHTAWEHDVAMEARRVTAPWTESTATWANMGANIAAQPAGNMVTVDDGDAGKTSAVGTWPYSTNATLTAKAVNSDYAYNNDGTAGHTYTWVPTITETGDYQVEVHFTSEADRSTATPYVVYYNGGSKTYTVDQTGSPDGVWKTLGVHPFVAGTTGKVVLKDVAGKSVIADAVRFTKWGAATKKRAISSVWSSFSVRNVVQEWLNGTQTNHGFMVKAVDESPKGRGGPVFEASEYAYMNARRDYNLPKLVLSWGRPGVSVQPPTTVKSTGAALAWPAYVDPSTASGDDIVEYQVHRSIYQTYAPSAATLVAPVGKSALSYQDTTAIPTPTNETDPLKRHFYYYMVAVKTADGQVLAGPTQGVLLPKAGQITKIFRETSANQVPDTTLSGTLKDTNVNIYDGDPYVSAGNNSPYYGDTRGLVKFNNLSGIPAGAQVVDAQLRMWNTYQYPGTVTNGYIDVHRVTRSWDETTATWNRPNATETWTPGGQFDSAAMSGVTGVTNDPEWQSWDVKSAVNAWLATPANNFGLLVKMRDEAVSTQRAMLLSAEGAEPMLRPTLQVTYLEPTAESTYYMPETPTALAPAATYSTPVTLSNPTLSTWSAATWELSYHWVEPAGPEISNATNQVATPLPKDILPGETVDLTAQVKAPAASADGNKRTDYLLRWELRNKSTNQWLSATSVIAALEQKAAVEEPTSDQLGLEKFYSYAGKNTGAGGVLMNNLYAGNAVWTYNAFNNPSRGLSTFLRLAYNSKDTSNGVAGNGWSMQAAMPNRLGTPLDFHPNPDPTKVTLVDGDGTSHWFTWDAATSTWTSPKGVHLFLERLVQCKQQTEESRAWVLTRPDRTQFFYDCDGYLSSTVDNNGNEMTFTYEVRRSQNKPTKYLRYITDPVQRQTLTVEYWAKGDTYDYVNDTTWTKVTGVANLTNPHIIDRVRSVTDVSGRKLTLTYTDKGLLGEMVDGAGSTNGAPKVFAFRYDMTQGNKNVKLIRITDPRGNPTLLDYYSRPEDDPKFKWSTKTLTDRLGGLTQFAYTDPDGPQGSNINTTVTDAENHATAYQMDGFGRPFQVTNAKTETTKLGWDGDHNVIRLEEANGAVSTWVYDQKTGYPLEIKDAEAVANGWPGTTLVYQTGLGGHIADVIAKQSPEGRLWTFTYTTEGDLATVTDPAGNATSTAGDYTTTNSYDTWGQLLSTKDANGNLTGFSGHHASGYPQTITDATTKQSTFVYDVRGNVVELANANAAKVTQTYDTFGRPRDKTEPMDGAQKVYTPAPVYDPNDNITTVTAAGFTTIGGAVSTAVYDKADQLIESVTPKDAATDPVRKTTTTYDKVGNVLTVTEPMGNVPSPAGDYTTTTTYDAIYQPIGVVDAIGGTSTAAYDNVGNVTTYVDAKKSATSDPADYTTKFGYDRNHRVIKTTDAIGKFTSSRFDRDGLLVGLTDADGNESLAGYDPRGLLTESKVPVSKDGAGTISYRTTRYEYDQVGNRTRVVTPRGVATAATDDFVWETAYDGMNRVKERLSAHDAGQPADKTTYEYDAVGNLQRVSAPPSQGQTVRNDSVYSYFDNGWTKSAADPWDITTEYTYNALGQQTENKLTSAGGSASRTMTWSYYPSGNQSGRSDDGMPVGKQVVLVDSSDGNNTATQGTWSPGSAPQQYGYDYRYKAGGTGSAQFVWQLNIPQDGNYQVFVRYPQVSGATTGAKFTVTHASGTASPAAVNETTNAGTWVSLGSYAFTENATQKITLTDQATGTVLADAVKLVRDNTGEADTEKKDFTYTYDANGMMKQVKDLSPAARIDTYDVGYDELSRISTVKELAVGALKNTTALTYDPVGNLLTSTHDLTWSKIDYDPRDMVSKVTNADSPTAGNQQVSGFTYTARGELLKQTKPNGNTVDFSYFLDGAIKRQAEQTSGGATVAEHNVEYTANGHPAKDVLKLMNADNSGDTIDNTYVYDYDAQDRVKTVTKSGDSSGTESYAYDANGNVVSQTVGGTTTTHQYDRNRLHTSTAGAATSTYNYDPLGRLDTVTVNGQRIQKYYYDGFDRTAKTVAGTGAAAKTTTYAYDPFDRTVSQDVAGKSTVFTYLGMDKLLLKEEIENEDDKSYQYAPWNQKLTQITHKDGGTREYSQYTYRPRGDVEAITKENGNTRATYGYTAYGKDDTSQFTGEDKPDAANPDDEPYNAFRFNASRWDVGSGTYDMGFRNYDPGLNRFLTRDMYGGALADMNLATDPFTGNRYSFTGGNPVSFVELDGHLFGMSWSDLGHAALDVVGLVPVVGEVADVANGVWYAAEGNYVDAALSMASAIPLAGYGATAVKAVRYGDRVIDAVDTANDVRRVADRTNDARRLADDVPTPGRTVDGPPAPTRADTPSTPTRADTPSAPTRADTPSAPARSAGPAPARPASAAADPGETYYRTMTDAHFAELQRTGRLPAGTETFISPTRSFSEAYSGTLVQFTVRPGTTDALVGVGVRDTSRLASGRFPNMPTVSKGWAATSAFFKGEGVQVNIGLGRGPALDIFNAGMMGFRRLR